MGITPYFKIYNTNAYTIINNLIKENIVVNHIITDPPYNISKQNNFGTMNSAKRQGSDIVDFNAKVDEKYYYQQECAFFDELKSALTNKDTLYQWRRRYVRENKSGLCPTLTANMGTGGHNVPIALTAHGYRKLTPKECFLFQGFPDDFVLPKIANAHLYKQAGNSVCVGVIKRIFECLV